MKANNFKTKPSRIVHKGGLLLKRKSPEIFMGLGIAGMIVSAVMACKATTKASKIIEETTSNLDAIRDISENEELAESKNYTAEDHTRDLVLTYSKAGLAFVKLYAIPVSIGVASIASILVSHGILKKRNIALAAAYTAVDKSFKDYKGRVIERFGEEAEKEIRYGIKAKEIEETITDENGNEKTVKHTVNVIESGSTQHSPYCKFFDETCPDWVKNSELNLYFLQGQQQIANDMLVSRGYLFLNEVYRMLGLKETKAGQIVGWIYDPDRKTGVKRDNYVDFGLYDVHRENCRDFVNGYERSILLDFNVDGPITDDFVKFAQ